MFETILVCLDGSGLAEQILPYATQQALCFKSKVVLLQAFTIPAGVVVADAEAAPRVASDLMFKEAWRIKAEGENYLEEVAGPLRDKGLGVDCVVLEGMAGETIVSYAREQSIGIIALATHGHGGLGRVIFGSVADHVLRQSGLPILIIRPQEQEH